MARAAFTERQGSMDPRGSELTDDSTPEDVAALYRWAGLTGAKYRDYSAERREQRARMRYQAARRELELRLEDSAQSGKEPNPARRLANAAARAVLRTLEEQREVAEAHESAQRKQRAFTEAERLLRERTGSPSHDNSEQNWNPSLPEKIGSLAETEQIGEPEETIRPAWLSSSQQLSVEEQEELYKVSAVPAAQRLSAAETLLDSREQVALRWPALQALAQQLQMHAVTARMSWVRGPVVAVVSPSGGAGGTSIAATIAGALAQSGERVLLVDAAGGTLLPVYFGAGLLNPGEHRTLVEHEGGSGALSIFALHMDSSLAAEPAETQAKLQESATRQLLGKTQGCDRVVIDLAPDAVWLVRRLASLRPMVLAPLVPEMSSVAGLRAIEQAFSGIVDREGRTLAPFYVLNRFDPGLPLHLDIREILRRELDGRLLPVVVRRSPVVSEALAEGTTALNYAPNSPVADDYRALARWLVDAAPASAEAIPDAERGAR